MAFTTPQAVHSTTFTPPPLDGSIISVPEVFDYHRKRSPNHPLFVYEEAGELNVLTWSQTVRAVHTAARYIEHSVSTEHAHDSSVVIGVLANTDPITFFVLIVGILHAGYQAFPISPRNSPAGVAHLLQTTGTKYLLLSHDPGIQRLAALTCAQPSMRVLASRPEMLPLPTFEYLFGTSEDDFEPLPMSFHPEPSTPALILHTSGSMSFPKPISLTFRNLYICGLAPCSVMSFTSNVSYASLYRPSMMTGLVISTFSPNDIPLVPNPDRVLSGAVMTRSNFMFCVPSFLEIYAGAPMHKESGDRLAAAGVKLFPFFGSTEVGPAVSFVPYSPPEEGWEYFKFSPHCHPVLVPYCEDDNIFQVLFLECCTHSPHIFNTVYEGMQAFDSSDLVQRHSTNPYLWRVYGRRDEQIIQSTGEKTNPVPIESMLRRHPKIKNTVLFGRGRFHIGVIIELVSEEMFDFGDDGRSSKFRNEIWPLVEQANERSPTHSRLFKEMILFSDPARPFPITPKGTPERNAVLQLYASEIERAYAAVEESSQTDLPAPDAWELEGCIQFVRAAVARVLKDPVKDDDDIFQVGCDSLQATWIRNTILHALRHSAKSSHASTMALFMSSGTVSEMEELRQKYSNKFHKHRPHQPVAKSGGDVVLLTGSTGFFGSHTLVQLVNDPTVLKIYAFNRRDVKRKRTSYARHEHTFCEYRLDQEILNSKKVVFLEGDLCSDSFDMNKQIYQTLCSEITCIIHAAWKVDFNITLSSFEPVIAGTWNLINFALASSRPISPRFVFVASLGIFSNWSNGIIVPEGPNIRPLSAVGTGYTESKWVTERIIANAVETAGLDASIIRVGHLCGNQQGSWNCVEWVPALVRSGKVLGCLPCPNGLIVFQDISWLPIHIAAAAVVEMRHSNTLYMNVSHPKPISSSEIFPLFAEALKVPIVSYPDWLKQLEASRREISESETALQATKDNPALNLLEFFRAMYRPAPRDSKDREAFGFPSASISRALAAAPNTLGNAPQLTRIDVISWLKYWGETGYLAL
ncbi:hypothetical protein BDQ17DRAFT_1393209 [Cyathus striatus]|nr:hypothetical protein BDQ17DRAFT_1393209 [Cyathus striatus]